MFKPTRSRKAEFDDWWNQLYDEIGVTAEQKAEIFRQVEEFKLVNAQYNAACREEALEGLQEGESIEDFKVRKLRHLQIIADEVNEL